MDIEKLIAKMTLEQKLAQLSQYNAVCLHLGASEDVTGPAKELSLTREQVASVGSTLNFKDAAQMREIQDEHLQNDPNKIPMLFMMDVVHGYKTIYPIPLAMGCSFDTKLMEDCCDMAAKEMATGGVSVTFGPMVDLVRDPRWGRCMETTGEDTFLNCEMSKAQVRGFQKSGKAACVKHYAAYGQAEAGRDYNTTDISERTLRDYYLPAYKAAVDEGVEMVMTSFNILNGIPSSGNKWLVKNVLRDEWGFDGVVISDYMAFEEMRVHGYCATIEDCAKRAIDATSDVEMMSSCYLQKIPELIEKGEVSIEQIDKAVYRFLKLKEKLGTFKDPYLGASTEKEESECLTKEYRALARKAAEKSAVLLKNDNVLPFDKNVKKVAVIGPYAEMVMLGEWACHGSQATGVSLFQGVKNVLPNAQIEYAQGCSHAVNETDCSMVEDAARLAKTSDIVILTLGEHFNQSGEGRSRAELRLSQAQKTLLKEVVKANKNTAVVLFNGRPLVLTDVLDDMPALVEAWQPGTEGGNAIARLLFGEVNFSGKLTMTFPLSEGQIPIYYNNYRTGRPPYQSYSSWYQDMSTNPLFEFGYGLSYTQFAISEPTIDRERMERGKKVKVSAEVENTGERAGEVVVQMYICDEHASLTRPMKELKGYEKIALNAGEKRTVTFEIDEKALEFWSENNKFEAESGWFKVWVALSSNVKTPVRFKLD